jgi:aspartate aminotransferase
MLSERISTIQPSPTLALNAKANQLRKSGRKIYNFSVGEPDYPTPEIVVNKAIESLKAGRTRYSSSGGSIELRQAIVDKLKRDNELTFTPDQVVVGIGAKEILFHTFLAILNEGDEVLLTSPCWVSYADQIKAAGAIPVIVPMTDDGRLNLDAIEKHATKKTKAFVVNSPNNPCGYVLSPQETKALGSYLASKNWWIISDEIYEYLAFDHPHTSPLQVCPELKTRFILINGLSKSFAMTGWRVGYMAGPQEVATLVKSLESHSSTCLPAFIEDAAIVALNAGKNLMAHQIETLKTRRQLSLQTLKSLGGFKYVAPEGAFYVFIDVRPYQSRLGTSLQISEYLLNEHGLAMAPGEAFGCPGWIRLSYAVDDQTIEEGLKVLHGALASPTR